MELINRFILKYKEMKTTLYPIIKKNGIIWQKLILYSSIKLYFSTNSYDINEEFIKNKKRFEIVSINGEEILTAEYF
jgi:hypothetical protein